MKIVFNAESLASTFAETSVGDVFFYDGCYYIKIVPCTTDNIVYGNALLIRNNPDVVATIDEYTVMTFGNTATVYPVDTVLTINQIDAQDETSDTDTSDTVTE